MLPTVLVIAAAAALAVTAVAGVLLPRYRKRRAKYYTRPTMFALIAGLLATASAFISLGWTGAAWGAGAVAAWLFLEGIFALVFGGSEDEPVEEDRVAQRKRAEQKLIKKHQKKRA